MSQGEATDELRALLSATRALLDFHRSTGAAGLPLQGPDAWPPRVDDLLTLVPAAPPPAPRPLSPAPAPAALAAPAMPAAVAEPPAPAALAAAPEAAPAAEPAPPVEVAPPVAPAPTGTAPAAPATTEPPRELPTEPAVAVAVAVAPVALRPLEATPAATFHEAPATALTPEPPFGITALPPATEAHDAGLVSAEPPAVSEVTAPAPPVESEAVVPPAVEPAHQPEHEEPARDASPRALFEDEPIQSSLFGMLDEPRKPKPLKHVPADLPPARSEAALRRLDVLAQKISGCTLCPLHVERTQTVFARGNPAADLCFIGEAPGADEDTQGQPFVGRAGQLLDRMIAAMGLQQDEVYITNICRCRPPKNRTPTPEEMAACMPYLHEQVALTQPRVIVALGATATKGLLSTSLGIRALRGTWKLYRGSIPVMPTYHPAYLLRETEAGNLDAKRDVWKDLQAVLERLGRPLPSRGKK